MKNFKFWVYCGLFLLISAIASFNSLFAFTLGDYVVNPSAFQNTMTITGSLEVDNNPPLVGEWRVGLFRGSVCHGVADLSNVPPFGFRYFLTAYGNPADEGQPFDIFVINVNTGLEYPDLGAGFNFAANGILGDIVNPHQFEILTGNSDTTPPNALCIPSITRSVDENGDFTLFPDLLDGGSSDANGIKSFTIVDSFFDCSDIGNTPIELIVTDNFDNTATCNTTLSLLDSVPPIALCSDLTLALNTIGVASISGADVDGGSSDNCTNFTLSVSPSTFICANKGINTVTLTATDPYTNASSCVASVTIIDTTSPILSCQNINAYLNPNGIAPFVPVDVEGNGSDNCVDYTLSLNISSFLCEDVGPNTVILTSTDTENNTSTCTSTVTVLDTLGPIITCQDITVQLDAFGDVNITPGQVESSSTDNCAIFSYGLDVLSFDCDDLGQNVVNLTVTDVNANTTSCEGQVTVTDVRPPVINSCPVTITKNNIPGTCYNTATWTPPTAIDECGIDTMMTTNTPGDTFTVGANVVTYTAIDLDGNSTLCSFNVMIGDITHPVFVNCPANITKNVDVDQCGALVNWTPPTTQDNCVFTLVTSNFQPNDFFPVGTTEVVYSVDDVAGNTTECIFDIQIIDNQFPEIVGCPSNINANTDAGVCGANISWTLPTSIDNCVIDTLFSSHQSGDFFIKGITNVTYTTLDTSGNSTSCNFDVTITDITPPTLTCQDVGAVLDSFGNASVTYADLVVLEEDPCGIQIGTIDDGIFTTLDTGINVVVLSLMDTDGNLSTCTSQVTVSDDSSPIAKCKDISIELDPAGSYTLSHNEVDNGSFDNLGIVSYTLDVTSFSCIETGQIKPVVLTVADINSLTSSCTSLVSVTDTQTPLATTCPTNISMDIPQGSCEVSITWNEPVFSDNCPNPVITSNFASGSIFPKGVTTITYEALDAGGNAGICTFTVTAVDVEDPVFSSCPTSLTVPATPGQCASIVTWSGPVASDNCDAVTISSNFDSGDSFPVGTTIVSYSLSDLSFNQSFCTFLVTVLDQQNPVAVCQDATIQLDNQGVTTLNPVLIDGGGLDACGYSNRSAAPSSFDCASVGTQNVVLTISDDAGNASSCTAGVTIVDPLSPVAVCKNHVLVLPPNGIQLLDASQMDGGSLDNCPLTFTANPPVVTCADVGPNTITITATDPSGNTSQCTSQLTVNDAVVPNAVCASAVISLNPNGSYDLDPSEIDGGTSDNCNINAKFVVPTTFSCLDIGINPVVLTVFDVSGNSASCATTVIALDQTPPSAMCQDLTIELNNFGVAVLSPSMVDNGSSDVCSDVDLELDVTEFGCGDVGSHIVTLTVSDSSLNMNSCTANVQVANNTPSQIECLDDITVTTDPDQCGAVVFYTDPSGNTICGLSITQISGLGSGAFFPVGTHAESFLAEDGFGNSQTCDFTVTVNDNQAPAMTCPPNALLYDINSACGRQYQFSAPTATDNCGTTQITQVAGLGNYQAPQVSTNLFFPVGTIVQSYLATDLYGNSSGCSFTVEVRDTLSPTIACPGDVLGSCTPMVSYTLPIVQDNCASDPVLSLLSGLPSGANFPLGMTTVIYSVSDNSANTATCSFEVHVQDSLPTATCQDVTVQLDSVGNYSLDPATVDGGAANACTSVSLSVSPSVLTCNNLGNNVVTLSVTDPFNNISSCVSNVMVLNHPTPQLVCSSDLEVNATPGLCGTDVFYGNPFENNACQQTVTLQSGLGNGAFFPVGSTTETYLASDVQGNTSTCSFTVTVINANLTSLICPPSVQIGNSPGECGALYQFDLPTGSDNCAIGDLILSGGIGIIGSNAIENNLYFPVGTTTQSYTAVDANNNAVSCSFTVEVTDTEGPALTCPADFSVNCGTVVTYATPTALDQCDGALSTSLLSGLPSGSNFTLGINTVTYVSVDFSGNAGICSFDVTVTEAGPTAVCVSSFDLEINSPYEVLSPSQVDGGSTDNCAITNRTLSKTFFNCTNLGQQHVVLTVSDALGNTSTCSSMINVLDALNPVAICKAISLQLDATGNVFTTPQAVNNGSLDNCGSIGSMSLNKTQFTCDDIGVNTVILTVSDNSGNTSSCTAAVTVTEYQVTTLECPENISITTGQGSNGEVVMYTEPLGWNPCNQNSPYLVSGLGSGALFPLGVSTETWQFDIPNGSPQTCSFDITIESASCIKPVNVSANLITATSSVISWETPNGFVPGFQLAWKEVNATNWTTWNVTDYNFQISGLTPQTSYMVKVKDWCGGVGSTAFGFTQPITFTTLAGNCAQPTLLEASNITDIGATLSWVSFGYVPEFQVAWREIGAANWYTRNTTSSSANINNLRPLKNYEFKVKDKCGVNGASQFGWSPAVPFTTPLLDCSPAENITFQNIEPHSVTVSWFSYVASQKFQVAYKPDHPDTLKWKTKNVTGNSVNITNLYPDMPYRVKIKDRCNVGNTSRFRWSEHVFFATPQADCARPTPIWTNLNSSTEVTVIWTNPIPVGTYQVSHRLAGSNNVWKLKVVQDTFAVLNGLTPGQTYEWRVRDLCDAPLSQFGWTQEEYFTMPVLKTAAGEVEAMSATELSVNAYPVPFSESLKIEISGALNEEVTLEILDLTGRILVSEVISREKGLFEMDTRTLPKGIFMLRLSDAHRVKILKVEKK